MVNAVPPPPPSRQGPGDPSIRRTWWLLAGAFAALALVNGARLILDRQPVDWLTVGLVIVAAVAAIAHRNAVAGLESRGRGEAESFARILRGLSHSVSADAIVAAILDDLIDATAADHVVLVRRRQDGVALDATLVSRRAGVPTTTTLLPLAVLDAAPDAVEATPVAVPIAVEPEPAVPPDAVPAEPLSEPAPVAAALPRVARRASDVRGGRMLIRRIAAEGLALLRDVGLPTPDLLGMRGTAKPSEVLARGPEALVAERVADRVRSAFGLSHTLTAPLRSGSGVIGAIVLSRRDRDPWPQSARRLVRGAATETAAALERASSQRQVAASRLHRPTHGPPEPALLRGVLRPRDGPSARRRRAGSADDRHR